MARTRDGRRRRAIGLLLLPVVLLALLVLPDDPPPATLPPSAGLSEGGPPRFLLGDFGFPDLGPAALWAEEDEEEEVPSDVPVAIVGEVRGEDAEDLGRWLLRLSFTPTEDITRAYRIELRVLHGAREVLRLDHSPKPPTPAWRKGKTVSYEVPIPVPFEAGLDEGDRLDFRVSFFDPDVEKTIPPRTEGYLREGRLTVADVVVPALGPTDAEEVVTRILARGKALAAEGRKADAWKALERGLRRAEEDATKERFRDGILALGHFDASPLSFVEEQIVQGRIEAERVRWLRRMSGRYYDRGKLRAALRILETIGGSLAEQADAAVVGALAQARRTQKDIQQIRVRLLAEITSDEDEATAQEALEKLGYTQALLDKAESWFSKKQFGPARYVFRDLSLGRDGDLATAARKRLDALDETWLATTPPDEMQLIDEAVHNPAFDRLATVVTHAFVYIGPKTLVEGIPPRSRLRFDLAFVFLTDLFGRLPNPGGDRITVFFKELWDFGGGQAAGKKIDIGRAQPDQRGYRVDTGLLYHELTHCVDNTIPIFAGWREGLANMGAAYTFEAMGQKGDELHAFRANLDAFRRDYLGRDLEYWRIPGYGPSAGFFLHFEETYAKTGTGHDWKPYRRFFRAYRGAPVRDGREPYVARVFAHYLVDAFGPAAFDDLLAFRFPLVESDREALKLEVDAFALGERPVASRADTFREYPNSPLPRDLLARRMLGAMRSARGHEEARRISKEDLGILHDWWVIGPFRSGGADPRLHVFAPEFEVDFAKEYADDYNVCKWRRAGEGPVIQVTPTGWVDFRFSYQENTATYALTNVTVPDDVLAHAHVRADDDFTLFVNDRLVDGYVNRGANGSTWLWWRGPSQRVPDAMRLPVRLRAGRNKILVKVKNRSGGAGFVFALSHPDGRPIEGLVTDLDPPATEPESTETAKTTWKTIVRHAFRTKSFSSKLETAVGVFKVVNRRLHGQSTGKGVRWRPYTVRPGFPKDSPSNLAWLREKHTDGVDAFRLTLDLVPKGGGVPKLVVSFQAEGGNDGLSGWNLIVVPRGKNGKVGASLERYDRIVYQTRPLVAPGGEIQRLVLTYRDARLRVALGEVVLLDDVPIQPIPARHRIGFSTFGPGLGLAEFRLEAPK